MLSSDEDDFNSGNNIAGSESEDEGLYAFKRNRNCNYHKVRLSLFGFDYDGFTIIKIISS